MTTKFSFFFLKAEGILNNFLSEGDELIKQIKKELNETPYNARKEMVNFFAEINQWNTFKVNDHKDI